MCKRLLGFRSGPEDHTFYACEAHREDLDRGNVMCFFALRKHPISDLSPEEIEDDIECDLCREG